MEEWRDIVGYPNYSISSYGRVYSHKRNIILVPFYDNWGYPRVTLNNEYGPCTKSIHKLVANAFIPNIHNKPEINHIDGDKDNNRYDNLEWVTRSENELHAFRTGLNRRDLYEAGRPKRKVMITETGQTFDSIHSCANELRCTDSNVVACLTGRTKTCKGYTVIYC